MNKQSKIIEPHVNACLKVHHDVSAKVHQFKTYS